MAIVYLHRRKDNPEHVFYVGIGNRQRPLSKHDRSDQWHKEVEEHGYLIEIYKDNLKSKETYELEKKLISFYGRKDLGLGPLVNMTDGGKGKNNHIMSKEQIEMMRKRMLENNPFKGKKHSEETKKILSEKKKGKPSWNKGKTMNYRNGSAKLSDNDVRYIRKHFKSGSNQYNSNSLELSKKFNVSTNSIRNCVLGITYKDVK
jgi:hypothetical protein